MPDISIIVPVYNSEEYLDKCILSLLNQTKKELEFIIINDGSTDSSENIILNYKDKRIKYYKNKNQGIGKTRNFGIQKAKGKFLMFIDSDDYIDPSMCEVMYNKVISEDLDIAVCNYYRVCNDVITKFDIPDFNSTNISDNRELLLNINLSPWNKLYRTKLIKDNKIRFVEDKKYEDAVFVVKAIDKASRIGKVNEYLNYYVIHDDSETTIVDERVFDIIDNVDTINKYYNDNKDMKEVVSNLTVNILTNYNIQQRIQTNFKVCNSFIKKSFNYFKENSIDYKRRDFYSNDNFLEYIIKSNYFLTKIYCNMYILHRTFLKFNLYIFLVFVMLFLAGLFSLKTVGAYFDEDSEKIILRMNVLEYLELFRGDSHYVSDYKNQGIIPISESVERDHGIAPYYPYALTFFINRIDSDPYVSSYVWHLYTYIICFVGAFFLFLILKGILKSKYLSLIITSLYFLSPRIFSDSLYNNKDMILLSLLLMAIYFGMNLIKKKSMISAICFGIVSAFMCNVKVIGFYFVTVIGTFYILSLIFNKQFSKKNFLVGFIAVITWLFIYIIITPAIWGSGSFNLIDHIKWGLEQSSNFSRLKPTVHFEGVYHSRDINPLPWYYLIKMVVISTPIIVIICFLVGFIFLVKHFIISIKRKKFDDLLKFIFMVLLILLVPIYIGTFGKPNLYNGWRHFYFLYASIIILAAYGIYNVQRIVKIKYIFNTIIVITIFYYFIGNIVNGVGGMTYYNLLVNGNRKLNYETDYYGVTTMQALTNFIDKNNFEKIYVYSKEGTSPWATLMTTVPKMRQKYRDRIEVIPTKDEYISIKEKNTDSTFYFFNTTYSRKQEVKRLKKVYEYNKWGTVISQLYK